MLKQHPHWRGIKFPLLSILLFISLAGFTSLSHTAEFDFSESTPLGSWSIKEQLSTNHRGKKSLALVKFSLLSEESFEGVPHVWMEIEVQNFKLKKDKRKKHGEKSIFKILVERAVFAGKPANVISNISQYGKVVIIQSGESEPIRFKQGDAKILSSLQAIGLQIEFEFTAAGTKTASVPAGKFTCNNMQAQGAARTKSLFKRTSIESQLEICFSSKVPFGLVHSNARITTKGRPSILETTLISYGTAGANSAITAEASEASKIQLLF